jgi:hypothetical protein
MVQRPPDSEDSTGEEETLDFDGTHTDQLDDTHRLRVVTASESGKGAVSFDDRGQAQWRWAPPASDASGTFNELEALENPALTLEGEATPTAEPSAKAGYDPYATGVFVKPKLTR